MSKAKSQEGAARTFEFKRGSSNKFWAISVEGKELTVHFGRIGTNGQSKTKTFASAEEARAARDKLIREKVREGYAERDGGSIPVNTAAVSPAPPATSSAPHIDLAPADWVAATWRDVPRPIRPAPRPFDLRACCEALLRVRVRNDGWRWNWEPVDLPLALSRPEARFWFEAMLAADNSVRPKAIARKLSAESFPDAPLPYDTVIERVNANGDFFVNAYFFSADVVKILAGLLSPEEAFALATDVDPGSFHDLSAAMIAGVRAYVIPFLSSATVGELRGKIRKAASAAHWPDNKAVLHLAAALGLHDIAAKVVGAWADDQYSDQTWDPDYDYLYDHPQFMVFGLGSGEEVAREFRRLKLKLMNAGHLRAFLAHTETSALDVVRDSILAARNQEQAEALLAAASVIHAPEAAPMMLELRKSSKAPKLALEWLDQNAPHAVVGLVPLAAGRVALAEAAVEHLRSLKRSGHAAAIEATLASQPADVAARVRQLVLAHEEKTYPLLKTMPAWFNKAAKGVKPVDVPWFSGAPPIVIDEARLPDAEVQVVLAALRASTLEEPHPLAGALRKRADRASLAGFAWKLFEAWMGEGAPVKENWALMAAGLFGDDETALKLAPRVRKWPGESQHQRAVLGLECLRAIGTDTALMQLNGISQKLKFKALKARASELMEAIAEDRHLTRAQLEDRIVPDCDLDERGQRTFDFGPRQFQFVLGPEMKAVLRDGSGKLIADLPNPSAKDDAAKAEAATADWKLLKQQIKEVAKIQTERLEQAMVTSRRWAPREFELLVARHPLLTHLARLLVWGGYSAKGALKKTFRVTEDMTYADSSDEAMTLRGIDLVGVVHPIELSREQQDAWGQILSDYELIPPFRQLGRPIFKIEAKERSQKMLARWSGKKIPAISLVGTFDRLGWIRGVPQDAGFISEHTKPFYGPSVTAIIEYPGVPIGAIVDWKDQEIERVYFVSGTRPPANYSARKALALSKIPALVVSEVLADVEAVASKARSKP